MYLAKVYVNFRLQLYFKQWSHCSVLSVQRHWCAGEHTLTGTVICYFCPQQIALPDTRKPIPFPVEVTNHMNTTDMYTCLPPLSLINPGISWCHFLSLAPVYFQPVFLEKYATLSTTLYCLWKWERCCEIPETRSCLQLERSLATVHQYTLTSPSFRLW